MTPSEREAAEVLGTPPDAAQRLARLHAAVLQHLIAGRLLEAVSACQQALALDPANADSLHLMGVVHLEGKQYDHAAEWAARAIQRNPKPAYLATLGFAFSYLGRHAHAQKAFDAALRLAPDDAQLWWQRSSALMTAGRLPEALASFAETLKRDPRHADAAYKS